MTDPHALSPVVVAGFLASASGTTAALLRRMRREFEAHGQLSTPTVAWMYGTYGVHAAATAVALRQSRPRGRTAGSRLATVAGYGLAAAGTAMFIAGMSRFTGAAQVSGMTDDQLAVGGAYRWSRNPQYVGYVAALGGLAGARRSVPAAGLAAGAAAAFAWWVPVEERHLAPVFGEAYQRYLARTPRWLGMSRRPGA
ncbi:methyltransferase family protein [Actinomycetospora lemnae]|uniref:Methyltransferase n=1 Tax=Actinomycetospora lemnae TaxID=3019891 RepID=A0ABT5T0P0_9PSEU|nr:methyltransferase [Actinomycetospora sp. DW7H6]MDD7967787.1 methyltransferase [Actinomycetospora sp. DW7H6]